MLVLFILSCTPEFTHCADCCEYGPCDANIKLSEGTSIDFAFIPNGEDPLDRYTLRQGFYAMTTEFSQGMFEALMNFPPHENFEATIGKGNNYPAYYVNWHMAADTANHLTVFHNALYDTSLKECYQCENTGTIDAICEHNMSPYACSGYRLPTEAEWEYVARSGTTSEIWTGDGSEKGGYPSGDGCDVGIQIQDGQTNPLLSDFSWYCYTTHSHPIALKSPNGFGLFDTHGNLWEWTTDDFGCTFPNTEYDNHCLLGTEAKVGRGGAFTLFPSYLLVSGRYEATATRRDSSIGFRLIRLSKPPLDE